PAAGLLRPPMDSVTGGRRIPPDSYLDPVAKKLVALARQSRRESQSSLRAYTAIVRQRIAAGLRTPLKDRTIFHAESAARVRWSRDQPIVAQVLAERMQHPGGVQVEVDDSSGGDDFAVGQLFDPSSDRLMFGLLDQDDQDIWIRHPLAAGSEWLYRFQSGDTMSLAFPDGRRLEVVELKVLPREAQPDLLRGTLWIEPKSGMLVRAAFKLARKMDLERDGALLGIEDGDLDDVPGILKPMEFNIDLAVIEYSLWEFKHWLPSVLRLEGTVRLGPLTAPGTIEVSYQILGVQDDSTPAAAPVAADAITREWEDAGHGYHVVTRHRNGRLMLVLLPNDSTSLLHSRFLPAPVWQNTPQFITTDEIEELQNEVADVPRAPAFGASLTYRWGPQQFGLLRYNRVEGLSVGASATAQRGILTATATGHIGLADLDPNVGLALRRASDRRSIELDLYHQLTTVDERDRALGPGNSLSALLFGLDDGEYYRTTGARLTLAPPPDRRVNASWSIYAERQAPARRGTDLALPALWRDSVFPDNITADHADQIGTAMRLRRWWGADPARPQLGADLMVQGETGDFRFGRAQMVLRTVLPITDSLRTGLDIAGGSSVGTVPVQRLWYLGGVHTLRGYGAGAAAGDTYLRARLELARYFSVLGVSLFGDAGWAGSRDGFTLRNAADHALLSAGAGLSLMEGLFRLDLARALRPPLGWRLTLYMDAAL
ncbi:MAG TPA: BamA/TamA family outer membrane protein, partial [Longimicrobiales bacterium]|nr:BamA/TamA family outer membrane protein [Longimicrobiales bacterium]